jgi:YHS domain-containing protein
MLAFSRRTLINGLCLMGVLIPRGAPGAAGDPPSGGERVALRGYDPVSYFTAGHPEKGSPEFSASFDDATYWFKNADNRALFVTDPDHYAPQFDGYCAIMVSRGEKAEPDPEAWAISDGKLYVFSAKEGVPVFRQQTAAILGQAAEKWPELHKHP